MNGKQKGSLGIQDLPVPGELGEDGKFIGDMLGIGQYADALSLFISECDTPITISIAGPWGSGKTSVMNMVRTKLDDKIIPVWFNCWQFSQFDLSANLSAVMMNFIKDELYKGLEDPTRLDAATETASAIFNWGKGLIGVGAKVASSVTGIKVDEAVDALMNTVNSVQSAKDNMEKMVNRRLDNGKKDRVVIFIDDLDRVTPSVALELLEVMKIFLDVKGCVFVLACDFDVVKKGVAAKFKSNEPDITGRNFFDKLIQLSFNMPVSAYNTREYVQNLLEQIGFAISDEDLDDYIDLLKFSIGFNPRSFKILANSLILMKKMMSSKNVMDQDLPEPENLEKIIFALTCMERAYPELYHLFITKLKNRDKPLNFLAKDLASPKLILEMEALRPLFSETFDKEMMANKIKEFVRYFINVLDTDNDKSLSNQEIENLKRVVKLSALTARGTHQLENDEDDPRTDQITVFCRKVCEEKLSGMLGAAMYPRGHSRKANQWGDYRYFAVWFKPDQSKNNLNSNVCYEMDIQPKAGNAVRLNFYVNKNAGIDGDKMLSLSDLPIVKDGEYKFDQDKNRVWIRKELGPVEITTQDGDINVEGANQIAQDLKKLIEATRNYFDV